MMCQQGQIKADDLMLHHSAVSEPEDMDLSKNQLETLAGMKLEEVEKLLIGQSLKRTAGNVSRSARELGLTRMAMRYRMEKYQL